MGVREGVIGERTCVWIWEIGRGSSPPGSGRWPAHPPGHPAMHVSRRQRYDMQSGANPHGIRLPEGNVSLMWHQLPEGDGIGSQSVGVCWADSP
jgi:hypothetical protein